VRTPHNIFWHPSRKWSAKENARKKTDRFAIRRTRATEARECRSTPTELLATRHKEDTVGLSDILRPVGPLFVGPVFGRSCAEHAKYVPVEGLAQLATGASWRRIHDVCTLYSVHEYIGLMYNCRAYVTSHVNVTSVWHQLPVCILAATDRQTVTVVIIRSILIILIDLFFLHHSHNATADRQTLRFAYVSLSNDQSSFCLFACLPVCLCFCLCVCGVFCMEGSYSSAVLSLLTDWWANSSRCVPCAASASRKFLLHFLHSAIPSFLSQPVHSHIY